MKTDKELIEFIKKTAALVNERIHELEISNDDKFHCALNISAVLLGAYISGSRINSDEGEELDDNLIDKLLMQFSSDVKNQIKLFRSRH